MNASHIDTSCVVEGKFSLRVCVCLGQRRKQLQMVYYVTQYTNFNSALYVVHCVHCGQLIQNSQPTKCTMFCFKCVYYIITQSFLRGSDLKGTIIREPD